MVDLTKKRMSGLPTGYGNSSEYRIAQLKEVEGMVPAAMTPDEAGKLGGRGKAKAINNVQGFGNSRTRRIAQLKKAGRDDLVNKVADGSMSANAAAIQAGLAKPPKSRPTTPLELLDYCGGVLKTDSRRVESIPQTRETRH